MENKTENRFCLACQKETLHYYNEGISKKNNRPYANFKCSVCGAVEWLDAAKDNPKPIQYPAKPYRPINLKEDKIGEGQAKGLAFKCSVDVAIAAYNKGEISYEEIPLKIEEILPKFKKLNLNGQGETA